MAHSESAADGAFEPEGTDYSEFLRRDFSFRARKLSGQCTPSKSREMLRYLLEFGYQARSPEAWLPGIPRSASWPQLAVGEISGHSERNGHTWYNILCKIQVPGLAEHKWSAPRRLHHLRHLLHDPIKAELGQTYYDYHFKDARFARHGALRGTTDALRRWLGTWSKFINDGHVAPSLVALTLSFLDAPPLHDESETSALRQSAVSSFIEVDSLDAMSSSNQSSEVNFVCEHLDGLSGFAVQTGDDMHPLGLEHSQSAWTDGLSNQESTNQISYDASDIQTIQGLEG